MIPGEKYKLLFIVTIGALLLTGILWELYDLQPPTSDSVTFKALLLKIHGAASFISMLVIGGVVSAHAIPFLNSKLRKKRLTGLLTSALLFILIFTGYLLYYASEGVRGTASVVHFWTGIIVCGASAAHFLVRR